MLSEERQSIPVHMYVFFGALSALVCSIGFFLYVTHQPATASAYERVSDELATLRDYEYRDYFSKNIDILYQQEGITGMVDRVVEAFVTDQINMFQCHSIAHDMGHYGGYPEYFINVTEFLSKKTLDFCGSGFQHGVEGQLANGPYPQNKEDLYTFCKLSMPYEPYYRGCYHGAGHAFMENTHDPMVALSQCDLLITDENTDSTHCYRGVFSEYANFLHRTNKQGEPLLEFCNGLAPEFQLYCASEVNGLEIPHSATEEEITYALEMCINQTYTSVVQRGCVASVAGTAADHILGDNRAIVPPAYLATLSLEMRHVYIQSTYNTFLKTAGYTQAHSLSQFCDAFEAADREYCYNVIGR
jgi:hypothetical protein